MVLVCFEWFSAGQVWSGVVEVISRVANAKSSFFEVALVESSWFMAGQDNSGQIFFCLRLFFVGSSIL
jgi:hypothetical protein